MKKSCILLILLLSSLDMNAVMADGIPRDVIQSDGSLLTLCQYGDENFHFLMTQDGFVVKESEKGGYYYAFVDSLRLLPTTILAHNPKIRNNNEKQYLKIRLQRKYDDYLLDILREIYRSKMISSNIRRIQKKDRGIGVCQPYIGNKKGLVILVEFPNLQMTSPTANSDFDKMFNEVGYSENNHVGSVHDYFFDQSYGKFNLTFDIVGPVMVSHNYGYYGSDAINGNNDMNVREMISEACILADEIVDYKDYDWDDNGIVEQVFLIYAGYGQATGGATNTIWPHEYYLAEDLFLDGVKIYQYACSNEIFKGGNDRTDILMGIGTACHEFSHCLGLPDFYDTDYSGAFGMSYWSLMNSGSYNGPNGIGEVPCGYSAYERWFSGWLDFIDIEKSQKIESIPNLGDSPVALKIINEGNQDEYYTLENRQAEKWFKYVSRYKGQHGLLVIHVDYDENAWASNTVNPSIRHQRMSPIVADNSYGQSESDLAGDLFPGKYNVTEMTNTSHKDYGGMLFNENLDGSNNMNKSLLNIKEEDGSVSLNVIFNNEIPTPIAVAASDITQNSFKAKWISNGIVDSYSIEMEVIKSLKPFVSEKIIIDDIYQTEYLVIDLDAESCNYKVRANKGNLYTEWSNTIEVLFRDDISSICNVENDKSRIVPLYSLDGKKRHSLRKGGVYVKKGCKYMY